MKKAALPRFLPPPPTPKDERCHCRRKQALVLMNALSYNPLTCVNCNLEREPSSFDWDRELFDGIAHWNMVYGSLLRLWLASGEYGTWAAKQLSDLRRPVNESGLEIVKKIDGTTPCYYRLFLHAEEEKAKPTRTCPSCKKKLTDVPSKFPQLACEDCRLIAYDYSRKKKGRAR